MKALLLLVLLLISLNVSALDANVPSSVPSNVSFGFSVNLDSTEKWTKTSLKVDDTALLDVYSKGTIVLDPNNGQFVQKAFIIDQDPSSNEGLTLFVSHIGLTKGRHTFTVLSESASDVAEIDSFVPIDNSLKEQLEEKITVLEGELAASKKQNAGLEKKLKEYESRFVALESDVDSLDSTIATSVDKKILNLQARVDDLDAEKRAKQDAEKAREEDRKKSPIAGFLNLVDSLLLPLGVIAAIIIVAGLIMVVKSRVSQTGLYKRDEYNLPVSREHEEMASELSDGKWSQK